MSEHNTLERRLYFTLKHAVGPLTWADLRLRSGLEDDRLYETMYRLRYKGLVEESGKYKKRRFWLAPGAGEPVDLRGTSIKSQNNLLGANNARKAGGVYRKKQRPPTPTHALEQCWGWLPSFRELDTESETLENTRAELRPQET